MNQGVDLLEHKEVILWGNLRQRINNLTVPATAYNACFLDSMSPGILGKKGPDVTFGFEVHDGNMTLLPFAHAHFVQPPSCFISIQISFCSGSFLSRNARLFGERPKEDKKWRYQRRQTISRLLFILCWEISTDIKFIIELERYKHLYFVLLVALDEGDIELLKTYVSISAFVQTLPFMHHQYFLLNTFSIFLSFSRATVLHCLKMNHNLCS